MESLRQKNPSKDKCQWSQLWINLQRGQSALINGQKIFSLPSLSAFITLSKVLGGPHYLTRKMSLQRKSLLLQALLVEVFTLGPPAEN